MKTLFASLICICGSIGVNAASWRPDERLLDALCQIESSGGRFVSGDGGLSLGHFQIQKAAWTDVVKWRKRRNLPTHDYHSNVLDPRISRIYAADFLTILYHNLMSQYQREPTSAELYAAYNIGLSGFGKCNYDLAKVNRTTAAKCKQIDALAK